jgi:hypothetical protein
MRGDSDTGGVRWPSVEAMLLDVANCMGQGGQSGHWQPVVRDGLVDWDVVLDAEAEAELAAWRRSREAGSSG